MTVAVYAALGLLFVLLAVQLQIVAGFSPLLAGTATLPVTVLMLLLSARAGRLATRTGPAPLVTGGLLLAAAGMLLASRIGPGAGWFTDVLPATALVGLGLSAAVAPLTTAVLDAAADRHAGVASGVNNAIARAAGLLAVAAVPAIAGIRGDAPADPASFGPGFTVAMTIGAGLLAVGAALAAALLRVAPRLRSQLRPPSGHARYPRRPPGPPTAGSAPDVDRDQLRGPAGQRDQRQRRPDRPGRREHRAGGDVHVRRAVHPARRVHDPLRGESDMRSRPI